MRYVWASIAAVAIILLGGIFVWQTRAFIEQRAREQAAASGHPLPEGSGAALQNFGVELSGSQMACVTLADFLIRFWYVFVVLVIMACFGVAAFAGRRQTV